MNLNWASGYCRATLHAFALLAIILVVFAGKGFCQSPSPTPSDEELKLQEQKRILELQRDIEQAKKAIRDAQKPDEKPTPTVTPLAGDAALNEGVRLETEMVSYKAMSEASKKIVTDIATNSHVTLRNIAIYDAEIVKAWRFYHALFPAFEGQVNDIKQQYKDLLCNDPDVDPTFKAKHGCGAVVKVVLPEEIPEAFSAGSTLLKSFIDVAALFRTETKIEGKTVTIDESALVAEVFRALRGAYPKANLYYPEVFPPRLSNASNTVTLIGELFIFKAKAEELIKKKEDKEKSLAEDLDKYTGDKRKLVQQLEPLKAFKQKWDNLEDALAKETDAATKKKIEKEIVKLKVEISKLVPPVELAGKIDELKAAIKKLEDEEIKPRQQALDDLDADIKALTALNDRFQKFVDEFVKVDDNGTNALALFIRSEDIDKIMNDANSYWLEIKSVSAGGNNRVRKNLIWFFTGARIDHSGGVILEYALYDRNGAVILSDKLSHYEGYWKPKQIRTEEREKKFKDVIP